MSIVNPARHNERWLDEVQFYAEMDVLALVVTCYCRRMEECF